MIFQRLLLIVSLGFCVALDSTVWAEVEAESAAEGIPELTPEELEQYEFEIDDSLKTVKDLTLGQRYTLTTQRREISDLIARRLGILNLKGDRSDLVTLQKLIERKAIRPADVRGLQSLGIVFGDILASEFDLHWVSYEDEFGVSKALRWRKTENYVFPVTLFSKRAQFNEKIDLATVFDKLEDDINRFKAHESTRAVFK